METLDRSQKIHDKDALWFFLHCIFLCLIWLHIATILCPVISLLNLNATRKIVLYDWYIKGWWHRVVSQVKNLQLGKRRQGEASQDAAPHLCGDSDNICHFQTSRAALQPNGCEMSNGGSQLTTVLELGDKVDLTAVLVEHNWMGGTKSKFQSTHPPWWWPGRRGRCRAGGWSGGRGHWGWSRALWGWWCCTRESSG